MEKVDLLTHVDYSAWASRRFVEAAAELSEEELNRNFATSHQSLLGTLAHIFLGDRIWLSRLEGTPRMGLADPGESITLDRLRQDWPPVLKALHRWVSEEADLRRKIAYRDTKGQPYETPAWEIILHVVNHATYHRGQVAAMFRMLGHVPPATDLIVFYRAQALA